jgi:hypothetical protein
MAQTNRGDRVEREGRGTSPGGATENSPGREPGVPTRPHSISPVGATESNQCRPAGAFRSSALLNPRLTPWATCLRPFGTGEPENGSVRLNTVRARDR